MGGRRRLGRAAREDKPILADRLFGLSLRHVMEHESFEDEETAALINESFVLIKVDREERPRRRRHLHGGRPGDDWAGRLAADRLPRP